MSDSFDLNFVPCVFLIKNKNIQNILFTVLELCLEYHEIEKFCKIHLISIEVRSSSYKSNFFLVFLPSFCSLMVDVFQHKSLHFENVP